MGKISPNSKHTSGLTIYSELKISPLYTQTRKFQVNFIQEEERGENVSSSLPYSFPSTVPPSLSIYISWIP